MIKQIKSFTHFMKHRQEGIRTTDLSFIHNGGNNIFVNLNTLGRLFYNVRRDNICQSIAHYKMYTKE